MVTARTTRTIELRRAREMCPLRPNDLKALRAALAKLTPRATITGWENSAPQWVTPAPWVLVPEAVFDVAAVVRVIKALCQLRHTKGRWARRALLPDAWQIVWVIAPVFGWKYPADYPDAELAGTRIIREAYIEVPRKNGKSTLSSGLAIVLLAADSEPGAEVYAAAGSREQARVVFDQSKALAGTSKKLTDRLSIMTSLIRHPKSGSFYRVLSKSEEAAHGLNVHGAVIDELHVHKRRGLVDAIETGTGAREQPLIITITTADDGGEGTIYEEKHERIRKCAQRIITIEKQYGIIWAADDDDDPFAESTWRKANPGLGTSPTLAYIRAEANKARNSASYFPVFCRLHLNRRIRQQVRFISLAEWDQQDNIQTVLAEQLKGRECYGGLDLSATTDLTSFQLVFPDAEHQALTVLTQLWMPESDLQMRIERDQVPYDEWVANGWLTLTEGNVVDYDKVIEAIDSARGMFDLRAVHHDRWQAGAVVQKLQGLGIESSPVPQTYGGMSEPTKMLERLVKQGRFVHGGHPVLRWMADSVEVMRDRANPDNVRPVKPNREKSSKRVDGITASVMAIDAWMRRPEAPAAPSSVSGSDGPQDDDFFRPKSRLTL